MIMFQKRSHNDAIMGSQASSTSKLYAFVTRPSDLLPVTLVLYKFVRTNMYHQVPSV